MKLKILMFLLTAQILFLFPFKSNAESYPTRPVRLLVPFSPGGTTDIVARVVAKKMTQIFKQQVIVDNRGGAGGNIGVQLAATSQPDGYTLLMGTTGNMAINVTLFKNLPYKPLNNFTPIALVASSPYIMVVNTSLPIFSVKEFINYAKVPSRQITCGNGGVGAPTHLSCEMFQRLVGLSMVHVSYKSSGIALADLMGGNLSLIMESLPSALPFVKSHRLKGIAHTDSRRIAVLPEVPTMRESGVKLEVVGWFGLFAPAGVPKDVLSKVRDAIREILSMPEIQQDFMQQGASIGTLYGNEFGDFVKREIDQWADVINQAGIERQ